LGAYGRGVWNLDGNIKDASGYDNHCDVNDGSALTYIDNEYIPVLGKALRFNNGSNWLSCGSKGYLKAATFTFTAWIYREEDTVDHRVFMSHGDEYEREFGLTNRKLVFEYVNDSTGANSNISGSTIIKPYVWYYVALTYDGTEAVIYLNGEPEGSWTIDARLPGAEPMRIGTCPCAAHNHGWVGLVDEPRIFASFLSIGQIQKHYTEGLENHKLVGK
jgi:hypothetical protein